MRLVCYHQQKTYKEGETYEKSHVACAPCIVRGIRLGLFTGRSKTGEEDRNEKDAEEENGYEAQEEHEDACEEINEADEAYKGYEVEKGHEAQDAGQSTFRQVRFSVLTQRCKKSADGGLFLL